MIKAHIEGSVLWEIVIDYTKKYPNDEELGREVREIVRNYGKR